jgi:hypothetical protein
MEDVADSIIPCHYNASCRAERPSLASGVPLRLRCRLGHPGLCALSETVLPLHLPNGDAARSSNVRAQVKSHPHPPLEPPDIPRVSLKPNCMESFGPFYVGL